MEPFINAHLLGFNCPVPRNATSAMKNYDFGESLDVFGKTSACTNIFGNLWKIQVSHGNCADGPTPMLTHVKP